MSFQDNGFELIGADEDPAHGLAGSLSEPVEREGICPKGTDETRVIEAVIRDFPYYLSTYLPALLNQEIELTKPVHFYSILTQR